MTQAINKPVIEENNLLDKFRNLTPEQQQSIVNSVEFMDSTQNKLQDHQEVSAYDLAKEWAGSVESKIVDLSTNKKYLQRFGR
jgi:hypothetical protein